jgi:hypothetical protein
VPPGRVSLNAHSPDAGHLSSPQQTLLKSSYDLRSDMEEPNNDIDTETLQAQIDLSMAYAQNLVASWLQPASGSLTQSSSRAAEAEAELQTLLRRPPRCVFSFPNLTHARDVYQSSFSFPSALGWVLAHRSRRRLQPHRHVSCGS